MNICYDVRGFKFTPNLTGIGWYANKTVESIVNYDKQNNIFCLHNFLYFIKHKDQLNKFKSKNLKNGFYILPDNVIEKLWKLNLFSLSNKFKGIDILHCPWNNLEIPNVSYAKIVLTIYDLTFITHQGLHLKNNIDLYKNLRNNVKKADLIISISENTKKDIVNVFGTDSNKIKTVYLASRFKDTDSIGLNGFDILNKYNIEKDNYILYVGTIEPRKNILNLVIAYKILRKKHKDLPKLVLVGQLGWKYEEILKEINNNKNIILAGYVEEKFLPIFYRNALFFIYPALYEGFGLPPLEAMTFGCPVITSNISSLPEVVGDSALLLDDSKDVSELVEKMNQFLCSSEVRNVYSKKSLSRSELFSWEKSTKNLLELYKQII